MSPRVLGLIVARGGSKGVPRKNLRRIAGLSLVGYKARAALGSGCCTRLILSSEDAEILEEGRRHGAETPFVRPAELASDEASSNDVVLHAMDAVEAEEGRPYDAVLLLEPSSPFATPADLDRAVEVYVRHRASLVVGVRDVKVHSSFVGPLRPDGRADRIVSKFAGRAALRRQDMEPEHTMNGAFYLVDWQAMRRHRRIYGDPETVWGVPMDEVHSLEIDTPLDLALAELVVERGLLDLSPWQ
ncbi:MAG TPA: acylneuraminate cytidylyltransferase family protein [Thermoanaerobaculia bacterium]|nr:acylneuraminate cytidylyltransferase family protein [Thermoanaerobaculia bacterium]